MLDLKLIRSQSETIEENCKNRNLDLDIPELLRLDEEVRAMNTHLDTIRQQRNDISKTMKQLLSQEERQPLIESIDWTIDRLIGSIPCIPYSNNLQK